MENQENKSSGNKLFMILTIILVVISGFLGWELYSQKTDKEMVFVKKDNQMKVEQIIDKNFIGIWAISIEGGSDFRQYLNNFPKQITITTDSIVRSLNPPFFSGNEKINSINSTLDSLSFAYSCENCIYDRSYNFIATVTLKKLSDSKLEGDLVFYTLDKDKISLKVKLERIWCCGNHNPNHCGEKELTSKCKFRAN